MLEEITNGVTLVVLGFKETKSNSYGNTDHKKLEIYIKESKNITWKKLIKYMKSVKILNILF